jgi:N-acetylglucosaminyldiphosphoundecaprenol N-acetyl-beta-D-mannosaminyltransferase
VDSRTLSGGANQGPITTCEVMGMKLAQIDSAGLLDHIFAALAAGRGGWVVTANLDFLRRHVRDPEARRLYAAADLRIADGMPLVWAARLQGDVLPERIAGASLIWGVAERAAREGRSIYLLGDTAEVNSRAAQVLTERWPSLVIAGRSSPTFSVPLAPDQLQSIRLDLERARPDLLLVGLGSPKQELLIEALRPSLPATWAIGLGGSFAFVAGAVARAPVVLQRLGLEWAWRLGQEPRRLARRYLVDDLPFAFELLGKSIARRWRT